MTPERASVLFRELLQTPAAELDQFSRRNGLAGHPDRGSLEQAQEILRALMVALQSGPGPNWQRINVAWGAMVAKHGKIDMMAMGPARPGWVRDLPAKPTLGDPAPGTNAQQQQSQDRQRFVPTAKPGFVPAPPPAPAPLPAAVAPPPIAPPPAAPMPGPAQPGVPQGGWPRPQRGSYPPPPAPQPNLAQSWHGQQAAAPGQSYASSPGAPYPTASQPYAHGQPAQGQPAQGQPQAYAPQPAYSGESYAQQHAHQQHAHQPHAQHQARGRQPSAHHPPAAHQPHAAQPHAHQPAAQAPPARRPPPPPKRKPAQSAPPSGGAAQLQALETNVSTYAAFCAACANYPERVADTQREYGVADETVRRRIDELWADRFDDDGDLHAQWEKLFAQFRNQIRR